MVFNRLRTIYDVTIFCKSSVRVTPMMFNRLRTIYDVPIFCKSSVSVTPMVFNGLRTKYMMSQSSVNQVLGLLLWCLAG
jgi:hypothetical protein